MDQRGARAASGKITTTSNTAATGKIFSIRKCYVKPLKKSWKFHVSNTTRNCSIRKVNTSFAQVLAKDFPSNFTLPQAIPKILAIHLLQ